MRVFRTTVVRLRVTCCATRVDRVAVRVVTAARFACTPVARLRGFVMDVLTIAAGRSMVSMIVRMLCVRVATNLWPPRESALAVTAPPAPRSASATSPTYTRDRLRGGGTAGGASLGGGGTGTTSDGST